MRIRRRGRRRGVPLWSYLTALVLIPLIGVGVLTAAVARTRATEADSAARAEEAVRAVGQLDAARSGVEKEIIPVLSLVVFDNPEFAAALGLPSFMISGQKAQVLQGQQRRARPPT